MLIAARSSQDFACCLRATASARSGGWGYNSGLTTHTLETHIYRLRQKVGKDAAAPAILITEAGGYKLVP
jgi:hypothetical protein